MSITLVTGVPGSGKTLYTIAQLLRPLIGATIEVEENGVKVTKPRTIYSNINGLQLDHELIDGGDNQGLRDWHKWAKPGSIICFDEFQKSWPPRPNGSKIPDDIQTLDTHRHMGVDFILITQNCMNVDRHILGLVDRHLHIRRVANMPMSVVYEWDHASKSLLFKNSITKSPWRYDKSVYKLYKSAEVHTKQRRKVPTLLWFILAGLCGAAYAIPSAFNRVNERMTPKAITNQDKKNVDPADSAQPGEKVTYTKDGIQYTVEKTVTTNSPVQPGQTPDPADPAAAVLSPVAPTPIAPVIAGCIRTATRCGCMDDKGAPVDVEPDVCKARTASLSGPPKHLGPDTPPSPALLALLQDQNGRP